MRRITIVRSAMPLVLFAAVLSLAFADAGAGDDVARVVAALATLLVAGKLGGEAAERLHQPSVLGELVVGIVLGNLGLAWIQSIRADAIVDVLAGIGVLILLFQVGVESTVGEMLRVGWSSVAVATLGVFAPFVLGWGAGAWLQPETGPYAHAFLGATLCATSVGITARVLRDLHASKRIEARIILGAAVVDDVLGLMILGVVSGAIVAAAKGLPFTAIHVVWTALQAAIFLIGAILIGRTVAPRLFSAAARLETAGVLLSLSLTALAVLLLFRATRPATCVLATLAVGLSWLVGALFLAHVRLNFINLIALPITFGIGVDYAVNLVGRYRAAPADGILAAMRGAGGPVVLCSLTTSLGYLALLRSHNQAVRSLGMVAVLGEVTCLLAAMLVLPSALRWMELRAESRAAAGTQRAAA